MVASHDLLRTTPSTYAFKSSQFVRPINTASAASKRSTAVAENWLSKPSKIFDAVLIPWNTCGAYQSSVLGVATGDYFMYAFFNLISPVMTLIYAWVGIRIKKIED